MTRSRSGGTFGAGRRAATALALAAIACRPPTPPGGACAPRGSYVKLALAALPATLDWSKGNETSWANYPVLLAVMRGLTRLDPDGRIVPDLAESWDVTMTPGPAPRQVYTFHLRRGLVWSDGTTPLVAEDFVFAWRRALLGDEAFLLADLAGAEEVIALREDDHVPEAEKARRLPDLLARVGVEALDDHTLRVTLASPRSYFLARLAGLYTSFPAPSRILGGMAEPDVARWYDAPGPDHPLVLGPYRVASWDRVGQVITLERNPHAAPEAAAGVERLVLLRSDLAPLLYEQCKLDYLLLDDPAALASAPPDTIRQPLLSTYWLGVNAAKVPLEVRRAIALAVDRPALFDGLLPGARPALTFVPPDTPGALRPGDPGWAALPGHDLARARALVAAAHLDEELTLLVRAGGTFLPEVGIAHALAGQLRAIGLRVRLVTTTDFAADVRSADGRIRPHLFLRRTGADYAHPETFLSLFEPGGNHYTEVDRVDPAAMRAYEGLLRAGAAETDPERMRAAYAEAQAILQTREVVVIPLLHPDRASRRRPWIRGLAVDRFNFLGLRDVAVQAAAGRAATAPGGRP